MIKYTYYYLCFFLESWETVIDELKDNNNKHDYNKSLRYLL